MFAAGDDQPRTRRASDVVLLVLATTALAAASLSAEPSPTFLRHLDELLTSVPSALDGLWQVLADLVALGAVVVLGAALLRGRGSIARDVVLAALAAIAIWFVVGRIVEGVWPEVWAALRSASPPPSYPSARIAVPAAVILTAAPHLTLPMRRLGRNLVAVSVLAVVVLGSAGTLGALAGALIGMIASAVIHLIFGSSGGRPSLDLVEESLAQLGVRVRGLRSARVQTAGLFVVDATDDAGRPLVVKVYGRDAHDAALISTLWRTVWYRHPGSPLRFGRLQQVEHEAFLTLFAGQSGIVTDDVLTAGTTTGDDALLALRRTGRTLAELADDEGPVQVADPAAAGEAAGLDPVTGLDRVRAIWELVARLHAIGVAHGQLDDHRLVVDGDRLGIVDLRGAAVAATESQRRTDEAQALVTTVVLAGEETALAGALDSLGPDGLTAVLPYLQAPALTPRQRRQVRALDLDLDDLRVRAAAAAGTEAPAVQQLHRITWSSIVRVVLPAVALVALLSGLAGLDFDDLVDELADATWWLVLAGVALAQLTRLAQAVSTLGASPVPLPLGPVYALQLAVSYVNLAIPTSAARMAVNIRFFQRHGVPPAGGLAAGAIDGFSGFVVQALLLVLLLLTTPASLDLDIGTAAGGAAELAVVAVILTVSAIAAVLAVDRWRRFALVWARRIIGEAGTAVRGLTSPGRLGRLVGGNVAAELLFAASLAVFVRSLGGDVGLGEALLVNIGVSLLAGLVPIPGGIGVAEGGLTFGLVQMGVPQELAFAAVLLYRLWTFYLPPVWGYFAFRWLERNEHL